MTSAQFAMFEQLQGLGGPAAYGSYDDYAPEADDVSFNRVDALVERAQEAIAKGRMGRARRLLGKAEKFATADAKIAQKVQALSMMTTEANNNYQFRKSASLAVLGNFGPMYHGHAMRVPSYAPLFSGICQNVNSMRNTGSCSLNVPQFGNVMVGCPEMMRGAYGAATAEGMNYYGGNENAPVCRDQGIIKDLIDGVLSKTNMDPQKREQYKNGIYTLGTVGLLAGIGMYIFKRKTKDADGKDVARSGTWYGRAGNVLLAGI
jgi:hypothetical protein